MDDVDRRIAEAVEVLQRRGAAFAYLHGSRAAGTARPDSDIDIAAYFDGQPPEPFEVLLPAGVDLVVLNRAPLELAGRIALHGKLLFERDPAARVVWEATTRKIYFDDLPRINRLIGNSPRRCCAVVDEVRVLRLLRAIADDLGVLRQESTANEERRADPMWLRGVKYAFVTAIEACVDIAQHICAAQGWGPPADNGDAMKILGRHGALTADVSDDMRKAVGFRDVLVHEYVEVSRRLGDLGDVDRFVEQVTAFLAGGGHVPRLLPPHESACGDASPE